MGQKPTVPGLPFFVQICGTCLRPPSAAVQASWSSRLFRNLIQAFVGAEEHCVNGEGGGG